MKKVTDIKGMDKSSYLIDHTRRVFLMDPENVYLYHVDLDASEQQSAKAVLAKIVQNENRKEKIENQMGS
jgi:cytochrome oxidase Cu insertion factor (SCO1/SenC/PrrC family)